jgi:hypothetical protein
MFPPPQRNIFSINILNIFLRKQRVYAICSEYFTTIVDEEISASHKSYVIESFPNYPKMGINMQYKTVNYIYYKSITRLFQREAPVETDYG